MEFPILDQEALPDLCVLPSLQLAVKLRVAISAVVVAADLPLVMEAAAPVITAEAAGGVETARLVLTLHLMAVVVAVD